MVLLFTNGLAQKPMDRMKARGINKKNIPNRRPESSPRLPTINGKTAPPAIPMHNIPDSDPWFSLTELRAKENMMDHITEIKKPIAGKAKSAVLGLPVSAKTRKIMVSKVAPINNFRLSIILEAIIPKDSQR